MTTETRPTTISYGMAPITDFRVESIHEDKGRRIVDSMTINGTTVQPTPRFWTSLCSNFSTYGLTTKLFKMFSHDEVFTRLHHVLVTGGDALKANLRFALDTSGPIDATHLPKLLAVTNPQKPLVQYEKMASVLEQFHAQKSEYGEGIIRSTHVPNHMDNFGIGPDEFVHQYVMETPIDGFGCPLIYLSLMRMVCTNGMIGYSRAFKSEISLGRGGDENADTMFSIERALDSFSNEEGYGALRDRFETSTKSWASIAEANRVYKVLVKLSQGRMLSESSGHVSPRIDGLAQRRSPAILGDLAAGQGDPVATKIMRAYSALTGDICQIYGLASLDAISQKKMKQLPCRASMYELLGFATEIATHYCSERNGRLLQAEVGSFVSSEYDLELTMETHATFQDWFTDTSIDTTADGSFDETGQDN